MRKTALLLSFIIVLGFLCQPFAFAQEENNTINSDILLMKSLGAVDDTFSEEETVTRAQFVDMLIRAAYSTLPVSVTLPYEDVSMSSPQGESIARAYQLGLLSYSNAFNPDDKITDQQAMKIVVCALGYSLVAEKNGGYVTGYANVAQQLSLLKGVTFSENRELSGGAAARLLVNMFETPVLYQSQFGEKEYFETDKNLLFMNVNMNMYVETGIVKGFGYTSFSDKSLNVNQCDINGIIYFDEGAVTSDLIGQNVKYYYKEGTGEVHSLVYAASIEARNKIYQVPAKDILGKTTISKFFYINEKDKEDSLTLAPEINVIYNGEAVFAYNSSHLKPTNGNVNLIDNNGDGSIDVAIVKQYTYYQAQSGDAETEKVYTKDGVVLNLRNYEQYIIRKNNQVVTPAEIEENDLIHAVISNKTITLEIVKESVSGKIEAVTKEGSNTFLTVSGTEYKVSNAYFGDLTALKAGKNGIFYLTLDGEIIIGDFSTTQKANYMILLDVKEETGLSGNCLVQFFNSKGELEVLSCAQKVKINDHTYNESDVYNVLHTLGLHQLVIVNANTDAELTELKTAIDKSGDLNYAGYDEENFTLDKDVSAVRFYLRRGAGAFLTEDLLIFSIPTDKTKLDYYQVEGREKVGTKDTVLRNVKMYNLSKYNQPEVIVLEDADATTPVNTPHVDFHNQWFVCTSKTQVMDSEGMIRTKICGYYQKEYRELLVAENGAVNVPDIVKPGVLMGNPAPNSKSKWGFADYTEADIHVGDVMQIGLNGKGELAFFRMMFSAELMGIDLKFSSSGVYGGDDLVFVKPGEYYELGDEIPKVNDPNYMTMLHTAFGEIVAVDGAYYRYKTVLPQLNSSGAVERIGVERVQQASTVYVLEKGAKNTVRTGSTSDMKVGDKIFIHVANQQNYYMLIIRGE